MFVVTGPTKWWRPETEIPMEEHENAMLSLNIELKPQRWKEGDKQLPVIAESRNISVMFLSVGKGKNLSCISPFSLAITKC
jgi:hypothetical protein